MGLPLRNKRHLAWPHRVRIGAVSLVFAVVVAVSWPYYQGTLPPFLLFNAAAAVLLVSATVRPYMYGYTAFVIFLLLGFWVKFVAHLSGVPLLEPIGQFGGSAAEWDSALTTVGVGFVGASVGKFGVGLISSPQVSWSESAGRVPGWFQKRRRVTWITTWALIIAGNLSNWFVGFYQIGVQPRTVLPYSLNAGFAWWLTTATALWLATLIEWEWRLRRGTRGFFPYLFNPIAEGFLTTVVMLSRGYFIVRTLPYVLVLARSSMGRTFDLSATKLAILALTTLLAFAMALVGVSWFRLVWYPKLILDPAALSETSVSHVDPSLGRSWVPTSVEMKAMGRQVGNMIVGRWIGLEGVLAVTADPRRGLALLHDALTEDPSKGNAALYQQIAKAEYQPHEGFTFLTLAGVVAILGYSGSLSIVFLGMTIVTFLVLLTEAAYGRVLHNDFACAVAGVAMANVLVQMNFPYLTAVFFLEIWLSLVILWVLSLSRPLAPSRNAESRAAALRW